MNARRSVVLIGSLALAWCCGLAWAEPSIRIAKARPFRAIYLARHWSVVVVTIVNELDEAADLNLELRVSERLRRVTYVRPVHIPATCTLTAWLPAKLPGGTDYPVVLTDKHGTVVAKSQLGAIVLSAGSPLVMAVDDQNLLPAARPPRVRRRPPSQTGEGGAAVSPSSGGTRGDAFPGGGGITRLQYLFARPRQFPDHMGGLNGIGMVAIGHADHRDWRPGQVAALERWIEDGGVLVLFPGPDFEALRDSPMERLAPVRMFGTRKQNRVVLQRDSGGWEIPLRRYVDVIESEVSDGEVLLHDNGLPMVVKKRVGMGAVYFCAFPGSVLNRWQGRGMFLAWLLRGHGRGEPFADSQLLGSASGLLGEVAGTKVAPPSFVVATLGGFFVLALVSLVWTGIKGRGERAWAVIIPVGLVLALLSYGVGRHLGEPVGLSINELAVVAATSGSSTAARNGLLGVHSPTEFMGTLTAADEGALLAPGGGTTGRTSTASDVLETRPVLRVRNLRVPARGFPHFMVSSRVELGGTVSAEFQLGEKGLVGTVVNNTTVALKDCLLCVNSYPYLVGNVAPGESVQTTLSDQNVRGKGAFAPHAVVGQRDQMRSQIIADLFTVGPLRDPTPWSLSLLLCGWPERKFIPERLQGGEEQSVTERSVSLLCIEAVVRPAEPGTTVLIPRAFCPTDSPPGGVALAAEMALRETGEWELSIRLPDFASNVVIEQAEVHMWVRVPEYELTISGRDQETGELVVLGRLRSPDGKRQVMVSDAKRFQDRRLNTLNLHIQARPVGEESVGGAWRRPEGDTLEIREVSATLRGTAM